MYNIAAQLIIAWCLGFDNSPLAQPELYSLKWIWHWNQTFGTLNHNYVFEGELLNVVCTVPAVIHSPHKKSHCSTRCFWFALTMDFHPELYFMDYGFTGQELKDLAVWPYTKTSNRVLYCINNSHVVLGHLVHLDIQWCLEALILYMCLVVTQVTGGATECSGSRQLHRLWGQTYKGYIWHSYK